MEGSVKMDLSREEDSRVLVIEKLLGLEENFGGL